MANPNNETRNRYLAREILQSPPLALPDGLLPVQQAVTFRNDDGEFLNQQHRFNPTQDQLPADAVTLVLPQDFREKYGKMVSGSASPAVAYALKDHLGVPLRDFTVGIAFGQRGEEIASVVIMDRTAYYKMAKDALTKLSKMKEGVQLLGLKNETIYQNSLLNPDGFSTKVVDTLLQHGDLSSGDMRMLEVFARRTENHGFLQHLNDHRGRDTHPPGPDV